MNGKEILVDTNIFLYLLKGSNTLEEILQGKNIYVSFFTELELIGFKSITEKEEAQVHTLLSECIIVPMNNNIKESYVTLRRKYHLKLADAVIAATAVALSLPIITADKEFKKIEELNLIVYEM